MIDIPIAAAERVARQYNCSCVIVIAWDGDRTHVVTYGKTKALCEHAAKYGVSVAKFLGLITK